MCVYWSVTWQWISYCRERLCCGNVFTDPLPSNGYTRHSIIWHFSDLYSGSQTASLYIYIYISRLHSVVTQKTTILILLITESHITGALKRFRGTISRAGSGFCASIENLFHQSSLHRCYIPITILRFTGWYDNPI
jgi:hypothetical protein